MGGADLVQASLLGNPRSSGLFFPSHPFRQGHGDVECQVLGCAHLLAAGAGIYSPVFQGGAQGGQGPWGGVTLARPDSRDPTFWFQL